MDSCHKQILLNYHYHILLNPISTTGYRIQDKYQTYQDIVNYDLNMSNANMLNVAGVSEVLQRT